MRNISNIELLFTVVLVTVAVVLYVIIGPPVYMFDYLLGGALTLVVSGAICSSIIGALRYRLKQPNSVWRRSVANSVRVSFIDVVVAAWLCVVGVIIAILLSVSHWETARIATVVIAFMVAGVLGRLLRRSLGAGTLLPYGVSFTGALFIILAAFQKWQ